FFELYQPGGSDPAKLLDGLGREFRGDELSFKPYACGRPQHAVLDAAIAAREQLQLGAVIDLAEIAEVQVAMTPAAVAEQFHGAAHKRRPMQIVQAQFALPYLIAAALVHGRVGISEVADMQNAQVLRVAAGMAGVDAGQAAAGVIVRLRDGRTAHATVGRPLGSPANRLSDAQLATKFADCARNAVQAVSDGTIRSTTQKIVALE